MAAVLAYASEHGSTKEIAERISSLITTAVSPAPVDCLPISSISSLDKYPYIVLGSCVHNMQWLPVASSFLHHNSSALSNVPVWAFSVGSAAGLPSYLKRWGLPDKEDVKMKGEVERDLKGKVQSHAFFSGRFLREHAGLVMRWVWLACGGKFGDFTDWERIEEWGREVAEAIGERQKGE